VHPQIRFHKRKEKTNNLRIKHGSTKKKSMDEARPPSFQIQQPKIQKFYFCAFERGLLLRRITLGYRKEDGEKHVICLWFPGSVGFF